MTVWFKQGVQGDLNNKCQKGLGRVARYYEAIGHDLYVTSIREGNHGKGSLHYIGDAFDIGKRNVRVPVIKLKEKLGPGFDVVSEQTHYHIEYDPK